MREVLKIVCVLAFVAGVSSIASADTVLLEDDFNDGTIDAAKWSTYGSTVVETGGALQLNATVTDAWGYAVTKPITLDNPTGLVTLSRRMKVHSANIYFRGKSYFMDTSVDTVPEPFGNFPYGAYRNRVNYWDYHYQVDYVGFGGNVPNVLPPICDTWFDEVITYDPATGDTTYAINGGTPISLGGSPMVGDTMKLAIHPDGWGTGHYIHMDSLELTQAPEPATMSLLALGGLALIRRRRR